ncbi:MAG: transglutaminase-like cysteine peptidase [Rhizobiaceae bacterium]|jgi:predicted transglutaminase-like cysteine proteinase|nr:transglutaminase-like cysteine peptidase [Rhizobiaceae bacterium]
MKFFSLAAILLSFSTVAASANALHLNPQQPGSEANMQTFGKTSIPIGYIGYCTRYQERCSVREQPKKVKLTRKAWQKLTSVNWEVNSKIEPVTDMDNFGIEELWTYPMSKGDCEDYALLKRKTLQEQGFPLSSLLVTVVYDANGGGHAVLTVVTDKGDFILDNQEAKVLRWQDAELTYLKRQAADNPNVWEKL